MDNKWTYASTICVSAVHNIFLTVSNLLYNVLLISVSL